MNPSTTTDTQSSKKSLPMILKEQPHLYDLHAHLLGMGNAGFWIDTILMDELIMPTNHTFKHDEGIREALCPLVWDRKERGFVNAAETARFFHYLVEKNIFIDPDTKIMDFAKGHQSLEEQKFSPALVRLVREKLYRDLIHSGLQFKEDFSYDVILELTDLGKGLGIAESDREGFLQLAVFEKLGCHLSDEKIASLKKLGCHFSAQETAIIKKLGCQSSDQQFAAIIKAGRHLSDQEIVAMKPLGLDLSGQEILVIRKLGRHFSDQEMPVIKRLGCHIADEKTKFQHWITFNAREQEFKIVFGITVESLRRLIAVDQNTPCAAAKSARAHVVNAFSMCDAEGTQARFVDLHSFHGFFTPEFYPRRFALKDSIYSQRLDILAALLAHVIERYQTCVPPVKYCELSVGVSDLSRAWILDVLCSVRIYDQEAIQRSEASRQNPTYKADDDFSSFAQVVLNGHFPHLKVAFKGRKPTAEAQANFSLPNVTYKFLAGFDRRQIKAPFPVDINEALDLLYVTPHEAILLMMEEMKKSEEAINVSEVDADDNEANADEEDIDDDEANALDDKQDEEKAFDPCLKKLKKLRKCARQISWFHKWVVGLDLFGDELGYPYCPFVARPFINFVNYMREDRDIGTNKYFGLRIHGGENVKFATEDNPAYRLFVAHMYTVFSSLLFLQKELNYGIRIGHGIAFDHILGADLQSSKYRKSSVLMAEMRNNAYYLFKKIAFEVNITSNEYLLGQILRQGDYAQILRLRELFAMEANITLGTDDDGIWPIDQCSSVHPGHHSLAAEYCRAISTAMIDSEDNLNLTFKTAEKFCFSDINNEEQNKFRETAVAESDDNAPIGNIIVHPDIIRLFRDKYEITSFPITEQILKKYKIHTENTGGCQPITWTKQDSKLRVTFVWLGASEERDKTVLYNEYRKLFRTPISLAKVDGISISLEDEFNFIYNSRQHILSSFVTCEHDTKREIRLSGNAGDKILDVIIKSAPAVHAHSPEQSNDPSEQSDDPLNFLEEIFFAGNAAKNEEKETNIHAYIPKMDLKAAIKTFKKLVTKAAGALSGKGTLHIFTNTKKYVFAYESVGNILCAVNPTPSRRDKTEENFLYVLCHHASAATAAVHLVSEQLSKLSTKSSTNLSPNHGQMYLTLSDTLLPFHKHDTDTSPTTDPRNSPSTGSDISQPSSEHEDDPPTNNAGARDSENSEQTQSSDDEAATNTHEGQHNTE